MRGHAPEQASPTPAANPVSVASRTEVDTWATRRACGPRPNPSRCEALLYGALQS